jgi:hypothetical protein
MLECDRTRKGDIKVIANLNDLTETAHVLFELKLGFRGNR